MCGSHARGLFSGLIAPDNLPVSIAAIHVAIALGQSMEIFSTDWRDGSRFWDMVVHVRAR